ncbi:MAG: hypothetical protein ABI253_16545 [Mycobacterium sp.]
MSSVDLLSRRRTGGRLIITRNSILIAAVTLGVVAVGLAVPAPSATASPSCTPGDEFRQGYQCEVGPAMSGRSPVTQYERPGQCVQTPVDFPWQRKPLNQRVPQEYETVCRR